MNAKGQITLRARGLGHDELQAQMLAREGVTFREGSIRLARYQWRPR